MQATKAQKFKEYSDRLKELRVGLGVREYRGFSRALELEQRVLAELQSEVSGANKRTSELDHSLRELDRAVTRSEDGLRHQEGRLADARQQIAGFDATLRHERAAAAEHEAELLRIGRQRAEIGFRLRTVEADSLRVADEATAAEERLNAEQAAASAVAAELAQVAKRVTELQRQITADQERQYELVREAAAAQSNAGATQTQVERLQAEYTRKLSAIEQNTARRAALATAIEGLSRADADMQLRLTTAKERLVTLRADRSGLTENTARVTESLQELRVRQGDLRGRVDILEDLERSLAGLGAGARAVFNRLNSEFGIANADESELRIPDSAWTQVAGIVADLLTVPHDIAPLVELALGDAAQLFVVRSPDAVDAVAAAVGDVPGRVGFVPLWAAEPNPPTPFPEKEGEQDVAPLPLGEGQRATRAGWGLSSGLSPISFPANSRGFPSNCSGMFFSPIRCRKHAASRRFTPVVESSRARANSSNQTVRSRSVH